MRLDRHDRLKKALKKLHDAQNCWWENEIGFLPKYRLEIRAAPPRYFLKSIDSGKAISSRSVAAYAHWIALQCLLKKHFPEYGRGAFIGSLMGFPEYTILDHPHNTKNYHLRFYNSFKIEIVYKKNPIDFFELETMTSKLLACDAIDLLKPGWQDPREQLSEFEEKSAGDRAANWVFQTEKRNSKFYRNRDQSIDLIWDTFLKQSEEIASKKIMSFKSEKNIYPFAPKQGQTVGQSMLQTQKFIATTASQHYKKMATKWLNFLIKCLFSKTNLPISHQDVILSYFFIEHPSYAQSAFLPIKLDLSATPIHNKRAETILSILKEEFLLDAKKNQKSGELYLVLLIALQGAYRRPRKFSIEHILELTTANWNPKNELFNFENGDLKLSHGLYTLISSFIPNGTDQKRRLFNLSRSWINKRLKEINTNLGYNWNTDPVTAQTFLTQPEERVRQRINSLTKKKRTH